ncbi:MAG: Lrp/AsnC family transcriptional regulator [Myxococcales bacterium]|nr:Lrp/AsnC family transcriptional regulator [Myxococcales bacterium]
MDAIDLRILDLLQENCKQSLATLGEQVRLSAPAVMERVHKMEEAGVIRGYTALLDARALGKDVTAFIGVSLSHPRFIDDFQTELAAVPDVLESHHVTGEHTLMLKARTRNTATLEQLIYWIRRVEGVTRTETNVVLSSQRESLKVALDQEDATQKERHRRGGPRSRRASRRVADADQEGRA